MKIKSLFQLFFLVSILLITEVSAVADEQTQTCSCSTSGCYCDVEFSGLSGYTSIQAEVSVKGDFGSSTEYATISAEFVSLGDVCKSGCSDSCSSYMGTSTFDVTEQAIDGAVLIRCDASSNVNFKPSGCTAYMRCNVTLKLSTADTTPPTVSATGAPTNWVSTDQSASITCTDSSGCDSASYRLKAYAGGAPASCSNIYTDYTLSVIPHTVNSHVWLCGAAKDSNGNTGFSSSVEFKIDKDAPIAGIAGAPADWTSTDQTATVSCIDSTSGCDTTKYGYKILTSLQACPTDKLQYTLGTSVSVTEHSWICSYVEDLAGNSDVSEAVEFKIDKESPIISVSHSPEKITEETDATINATATDSLSGISTIEIFVDDQLKKTCTLSPCLLTSKYSNGLHKYKARATDVVNNLATTTEQSFKVLVIEKVTVKAGWNLMSIIYQTFDFISSTCTGQSFYHYDSVSGWGVVKGVGKLQGGKGYWFYSDKECIIAIVGEKEILSNDIQLTNGWNHVGSTASQADFNSIKGGCTIEKILHYDPLIRNWKIFTSTDKLENYKGYFIKAQNC